jgi:sigma-B regulation protein RsbU (phosphoserine phosphatase)
MDTILIVDDDAAIRLLIEFMLKKDSYRVLKAENGSEAQSIIQSAQNDVSAILLDWQMPVMNGMEFLHWIKNESVSSDIPVIMATSMTSPENIKEGIDAGAFYYLTKPFEGGVLRSIVRAAISDFTQKKALLERLRRSDNPFGNLTEGTFRFRTVREAEFLAVAIANSSPAPEKAMVISEILINAVEHGSLGITYEEKTTLVANNAFGQECERRLAMPENAHKYVEVKISRSGGKVVVQIEDQGNGFDFARYLRMDESRVFDSHGRGIAISSEFLGLEYKGNGSKVVVTIPKE